MEKPKLEWKDAATHRKPNWPLMGYAPGGYMGRCLRCKEDNFIDMDKRATHCLPCAIDAANEALAANRDEIRALREENQTLRTSIQIVSTPTL